MKVFTWTTTVSTTQFSVNVQNLFSINVVVFVGEFICKIKVHFTAHKMTYLSWSAQKKNGNEEEKKLKMWAIMDGVENKKSIIEIIILRTESQFELWDKKTSSNVAGNEEIYSTLCGLLDIIEYVRSASHNTRPPSISSNSSRLQLMLIFYAFNNRWALHRQVCCCILRSSRLKTMNCRRSKSIQHNFRIIDYQLLFLFSSKTFCHFKIYDRLYWSKNINYVISIFQVMISSSVTLCELSALSQIKEKEFAKQVKKIYVCLINFLLIHLVSSGFITSSFYFSTVEIWFY